MLKKTIIQSNLSSFRNGIIILIIGIVWMMLIFSQGIQESDLITLNPQKSTNFEIPLIGYGIAFYEIYIHNYQQTPLFAQILDPGGNIIAEQKIHTILSENFFDYSIDGNYVIRITNISEKNIEFNIKYGDTKIEELRIPELLTFIGSSILIYGIFRKMKNYSIAHP